MPTLEDARGKTYLDWRDRPTAIKSEIEKAFTAIKNKKDGWMFDGTSKQYDLLRVDQYKLLKSIILDNYPKQKIFMLLDIGAGEFGVIKHLSESLDKDETLPKDIKVHLIGIRGEPLNAYDNTANALMEKPRATSKLGRFFSFYNKAQTVDAAAPEANIRVIKDRLVTQYHIGAFPIEMMCDGFKVLDKNLFPFKSLEKKVDLIISNFTFIHLVDAPGTFLQAYDLLRPRTGMILSDGFGFAVPLEDNKDYPGSKINTRISEQKVGFDVCSNLHLYWLLLSLNLPFVLNHESYVGSYNQFLIRKPDDAPLKLPLNYLGIKLHPHYTSRLPVVMASFKKTAKCLDVEDLYKQLFRDLTGHKALFDALKKNDVFVDDLMRKPNFFPLGLVFSIKKDRRSANELGFLTLAKLKQAKQILGEREYNDFLIDQRHRSDFIQHEYDKQHALQPWIRKPT